MSRDKVLLRGWDAKGFRGYLRDAQIVLRPNKFNHVLLQMPNGTSKTTTMALLRSVLTGKLDPSLTVATLQADRTTKEGYFELHLSVNEDKLSIRIECDFEMGRHYFYTTRHKEGKKRGHLLSENYPMLAEALKRSINLFVFDGELAHAMLKEGAAAADRAIEALYRTDAFGDLVETIEVLKRNRKAKNRDVTTAAEQSAVERFERQYDEARTILAKLREGKNKLDRALEDIHHRKKEIEDRCKMLGYEDQDFKDLQEDIEKRNQEAKEDISSLTTKAITSFRCPLSLHRFVGERLSNLNSTLKNRRLPRSSRSFFEKLASNDNCVCGVKLDDVKRDYILSHADDHLGDEQVQVINDIRHKLLDKVDRPRLSNVVADLSDAEDRLTAVAQARNRLDIAKAEAGVKEVAHLSEEKEELLADETRKREALRFLTDDSTSIQETDWKRNLRACEIEERERRRVFETASANNRYFTAADGLIRAAKLARKLAKKRLRSYVREKTNAQLDKILKNEIIRVSKIKGRVHLMNEDDLSKDSASEGQKLAVCYAFLTSLLAESPARFPFIVDSLAVSLDLVIRKNVGELIPEMFGQLIVFLISSEREGFAGSFQNRSDTQFITASINQKDGSVVIDESEDTFFQFQSTEVSP